MTDTVVDDVQLDPFGSSREADANRARVAVADGVGQRLLGDAEQAKRKVRLELEVVPGTERHTQMMEAFDVGAVTP